ncbi:hypothetical protein PHLGIDRAFT_126150 [Phlebiopsis gigantea 11061_1 CR5-6]|uniref:Ubiquitin-like 1-activating enzyme E1A n=1 Tax=Phlebiopsis gigantea (strain 11061_1 CR5-6) TaxID=745531 RepID=A0A0C3S2U7_PHLG1|nr:hypothetical protein PHLGIDRAFT_126150 [Phlebiopsis gigantea 11061_1 CR5-6]
MESTDIGTKSVPLQITEDEAAVYDRQIRLWGLEAQQRMRNATILVLRLKGVATEAIKNIVLAGIGTLIVLDTDDVSSEDLGAGFFFRDEDVGKKKVDAAKARIESLNPLVAVEEFHDPALLDGDAFNNLVQRADLVCMTDWDREGLIRINDVCRQYSKPFYAGGTFGLLGYIFCDLLAHDYISPDRSAPAPGKEVPAKSIKLTATYCPLSNALQHRWLGLTRKQTKELNPTVIFTIFAIWEYQARHNGKLPYEGSAAAELEAVASSLLGRAEVNRQALPAVPRELIETMATTAPYELSPVCAVVGGMLAQDILKALAAREPPIANFFAFDGSTGGGAVCRMSMP